MKRVILATGVTPNYYSKAWLYLKSVQQYSNLDDNVLVCLDCEDEVASEFSKLTHTHMKSKDVKSLNPNFYCLQHGEFMLAPYFDSVSDDDVIVYTDADIVMQRPLHCHELSAFRDLKHDEVFVQYNADENDTLFTEYDRLGYKVHPLDCGIPVEKLNGYNIYNTGVVACTKKTWKKLCELYIEMFPKVDEMFEHYAKQQWLLSFLINEFFKVKMMSWELHNHGHSARFEFKPGTTVSTVPNNPYAATVYWNDKLCWLNHCVVKFLYVEECKVSFFNSFSKKIVDLICKSLDYYSRKPKRK